MKKLIVSALMLLSSGVAVALPLGNPAEPTLMTDGLFWEGICPTFCNPYVCWYDTLSLRLGFYGDYVFNRHMEKRSPFVSQMDHFQIYTNAVYGALNLYDRVDFFATLGTTNFFVNSNAYSLGLMGNNRFDVETKSGFSWSVGGRVVLFQHKCMNLGFEGQYFQTEPDIKKYVFNNRNSNYLENPFRYHEWQVGLGFSYRIWNFVPYIGAKFSKANLKFNNATFNSRFNGGYVVGLSLVDCEKASVTVEARYPDEEAIYVNGQFRF